MPVSTGELAPDIDLPASNGKKVKLSDFRGKNIVLYFYPKDMTLAARQKLVILGMRIKNSPMLIQ